VRGMSRFSNLFLDIREPNSSVVLNEAHLGVASNELLENKIIYNRVLMDVIKDHKLKKTITVDKSKISKDELKKQIQAEKHMNPDVILNAVETLLNLPDQKLYALAKSFDIKNESQHSRNEVMMKILRNRTDYYQKYNWTPDNLLSTESLELAPQVPRKVEDCSAEGLPDILQEHYKITLSPEFMAAKIDGKTLITMKKCDFNKLKINSRQIDAIRRSYQRILQPENVERKLLEKDKKTLSVQRELSEAEKRSQLEDDAKQFFYSTLRVTDSKIIPTSSLITRSGMFTTENINNPPIPNTLPKQISTLSKPACSITQDVISVLKSAAEAGDIAVAYQLGELYYRGGLVSIDQKKAFHNFKLAADREHPESQYIIGKCYFDGIGIKKNKEQAISISIGPE